MCLLTVYKPGAPIVREHLENGCCVNPDGFGFAVIVGDRIEVGKSMDADAAIEAFTRVREAHPDGWALFHSRITTDGDTNEDNCHPFPIGGDERTILAHNGILPRSARPVGKDKRSDTRILAETLIPRGMFGRMRNRSGRRRLEKWMGIENYPNKLVIFTVDPRYRGSAFILGESLGTWVGDVWHSNSSYLPRPKYTGFYSSAPRMSAEYEAYLAGSISYAEYIDLKFPSTTPIVGGDRCPQCLSTTSVDQRYGYCRDCKLCMDCGDTLEWCMCYDPKSSDGGYPASAYTDTVPMALADLSPAAAERALSEAGE